MTTSYRTDASTTPEALRRKREMAEALALSAMKPRNIEHWTQGLAQMLQAGVGGYMANRADKREAEQTQAGTDRSNAALAEALAGGVPDVSAMNDPWAPKGTQAVLAKVLADRLDPDRAAPKWEFNPVTGQIVDMKNPGVTVGAGPANPHFTGKSTDAQAKAGSEADRASAAAVGIDAKSAVVEDDSWWSRLAQVLPDEAGYLKRLLTSTDRAQFNQSSDEFINAISGKSPGSAVSQVQRDDVYNRFVPLPGEPDEVKAQKVTARQAAIDGLMSRAGPNYAPPSATAQTPASVSAAPAARHVPTMNVSPDGAMTPTQATAMPGAPASPQSTGPLPFEQDPKKRVIGQVYEAPNGKQYLWAQDAAGVGWEPLN